MQVIKCDLCGSINEKCHREIRMYKNITASREHRWQEGTLDLCAVCFERFTLTTARFIQEIKSVQCKDR